MEDTWDHDGAVRDERIVEDICRFTAALAAIIAAKGAKVEKLDNRKGRRQTKEYKPPRIEEVEVLLQARFELLDPPSPSRQASSSSQQAPAPAPQAQSTLPPKKRTRQAAAQEAGA